MTEYIAYLEAQKKILEQFEFRTASIAADTAAEAYELSPHQAGTPWRHGIAQALRAAAYRLDPVAV
jgi:hypothetical protein